MVTYRTYLTSGEKYEGGGALINFKRVQMLFEVSKPLDIYYFLKWATDPHYEILLPSTIKKYLGGYDFDPSGLQPSKEFGLMVRESIQLQDIDGDIILTLRWPFVDPR